MGSDEQNLSAKQTKFKVLKKSCKSQRKEKFHNEGRIWIFN